jgi:hypothetical protein
MKVMARSAKATRDLIRFGGNIAELLEVGLLHLNFGQRFHCDFPKTHCSWSKR